MPATTVVTASATDDIATFVGLATGATVSTAEASADATGVVTLATAGCAAVTTGSIVVTTGLTTLAEGAFVEPVTVAVPLVVAGAAVPDTAAELTDEAVDAVEVTAWVTPLVARFVVLATGTTVVVCAAAAAAAAWAAAEICTVLVEDDEDEVVKEVPLLVGEDEELPDPSSVCRTVVTVCPSALTV